MPHTDHQVSYPYRFSYDQLATQLLKYLKSECPKGTRSMFQYHDFQYFHLYRNIEIVSCGKKTLNSSQHNVKKTKPKKNEKYTLNKT